ncbi:hypothetical protein HYC85_007658 [Camellia sinensis]|uniref:Major facilitator superfamily (MFS) profile domain-containing protein n=1 Tax=Camellia sinensis TaxID=4442 RepID=A0A7J7HPJ4_CAMSI|nr:hypothetical protein HYC85_007658 [Camellia sinensis]
MADRKPQNNGFSGQTQTHIPALDSPQKPKRNKYAFACAILASTTSILLGYDGGVMSGAGLFIKGRPQNLRRPAGSTNGHHEPLLFLGCYAAGRTSDWVGRRYTIVIHT